MSDIQHGAVEWITTVRIGCATSEKVIMLELDILQEQTKHQGGRRPV
jgi:hypothetical protein